MQYFTHRRSEPFGIILLAVLLLLPFFILAQEITIFPGNPWFWQYRGQPVLLIGGSNNDNLFQSPDFEEQLELLSSLGGNYVRCTMSSRDEGDLWAFVKEDDGLYNLRRLNPAYWERFSRFLEEAEKRGVIVQVELWATFDFYRDPWNANPFNPKNNKTLNNERTRLPKEVPTHPIFRENPFFWSAPEMDNNTQLLDYQQKFVDTLLDISLQHGNVLYCIDNETSVTASWALFWARYIRARAKMAGKEVHVTEMWDPWELAHPDHLTNLFHDDIFTFLDISQNNHKKGQEHYDNGLAYKHKVKILSQPKPLNTVKTYGKNRHGSAIDGVQRFWRSAFMGLASVRFHRPDSGHGLEPTAQYNIKSLRMLMDSITFYQNAPHPELLRKVVPNEAFLLADPGKEYALYFPQGGEVELESGKGATVEVRWLNIEESKWVKAERLKSEGPLPLASPDTERSWAALVKVQ